MSLYNPALRLSEEAQDLILDHIRSTAAAGGLLRDFGAFCLVSRHWLSSGRRALYRNPLSAQFSQIRARSLIASLESNKALGRNVRNLKRLADVAIIFPQDASSEAWEFAVRVLAACPLATMVTLPLIRLMMPVALPQLQFPRPLRSFAIKVATGDDPSLGDLLGWIEARRLDSSDIERFTLDFQYTSVHDCPGVAQAVPSLSLRLRELVLKRGEVSGCTLIRLLPIKTDYLRSLTLCMDIDPATAGRLVELCGATIQILNVLNPDQSSSYPHIFEYRTWSETIVAPKLLAPLPRLRVLRLHGVARIKISALRKLIKSNERRLAVIDLSQSSWYLKSSNVLPEAAFDSCMPALADLISSLPDTCKDFNMGIFPIPRDHDTSVLTEAAKRKKVNLTLRCCCDLPNEVGVCICEQCV